MSMYVEDTVETFQYTKVNTLSESYWTTQKIYFSFFYKLVNQVCFVDIDISVLDNLFKILYSYGVLHCPLFFLLRDSMYKDSAKLQHNNRITNFLTGISRQDVLK